ncbi:hypothetical protein [Candidatus Nitrosocosmicus sp. FF01]|uniref:hypothetical protein n=1 Tax=Candidatus Nitrosocosmicus sp. FF01 TaxID=3397670 RepID=UPI0039E841BE
MNFRSIIFALTLSITFTIPFFGQSHAQVTWETFEEKNGVFSIQIPSNWNFEEIPDAEKLASIDYMFVYESGRDSFAWVELMINKTTNLNTSSIAESYLSQYQQFDDFNLLEPIECDTYTLNEVPACSFLSSIQLEGEQRRNVLNVVSVTPDGIQTEVVFITSSNIYESFLPVGEYIINSLTINPTTVESILEDQPVEHMQSEIPVIPAQNDTTLQSEIPVIPAQNDTTLQSEIPVIPAQNDTTLQPDTPSIPSQTETQTQIFSSALDTFVSSDPQGFGVYEERDSSIFSPGEDMILYIEPVGFEYGTTEEGDKSLYTINFSADFAISDTEGNILTGDKDLPVSEIVSHHQNKEVFIPFTISQTSPFPEGDYVITYTIHDSNSGNSFDLIKEITISED